MCRYLCVRAPKKWESCPRFCEKCTGVQRRVFYYSDFVFLSRDESDFQEQHEQAKKSHFISSLLREDRARGDTREKKQRCFPR
jgi:ABC-type tungstate transport system permease subunit